MNLAQSAYAPAFPLAPPKKKPKNCQKINSPSPNSSFPSSPPFPPFFSSFAILYQISQIKRQTSCK